MVDVSDYDGVGARTAQKLKDAGYGQAMDIARKKPETLSEETGVGESRCEDIVEQAREQVRDGKAFMDANQVREEQNNKNKLSTSSDDFDKLLGGGVPQGHITQFYGENSSGKTQTCLQLAVNAQKPVEDGGFGQKAIYIDTEESFIADRVAQIAEENGMDPDETLDNIYVATPMNSSDQIDITKNARRQCAQEDVGLVVVDSVIAHFRAEYDGRNELGERQDKLGTVMEDLKAIAADHDVAVAITNQVMSNPGAAPFVDPTEPIGGNILSHNSTFIVYLQERSSNKGKWAANLRDSPSLPDREILFSIDEAGISDYEE